MSTTYPAGSTGLQTHFSPSTSDLAHAIDFRLLHSARAVAPLVREHAAHAERHRRLAPPVLEALASAGLLRMLVPRALGGLETDPVTCARVVEEVAGADSAAGWALQAANTGAWWCATLPDAGIAEIYGAGPDMLLAASFQPIHRATEVDGGYRFTGAGPLASDIHDAPWVVMSALVFDGDRPRMRDGAPEPIGVVMRASEVEIVETWDSLGMRGTDSQDVRATDVFVPRARAFPLVPGAERGTAFRGPLYRMPAIFSVQVVVVPVALAIARGAITALRELAQSKVAFGSQKALRDRTSVQSALAEAEGMLRSARLLFYDTLATTWLRVQADEPISLEQRADLLLAGAHAARSASRVAELMHRLAGTSGIYASSPLERHFRDAQTVRHHGFVCESRFEAVGQAYLGVPVEFGLIDF